MFQIKGNFSYHLEVICPTLNDASTLTINAFADKSARIPIVCKYQWHKKLDNDKIKLEVSGNIYQCSVFDIGYSLEATITSFEEGSEGQATVEFNKIQITQLLEQKLMALCHNNMRQTIIANDQNWIFTIDTIENATTRQQLPYQDQCIQQLKDSKSLVLNGNTIRFKSKEDKDAFAAFIFAVQSLKRIHLKFIAYNIGKVQQKNANFQSLLNSQLHALLTEKPHISPKVFELRFPSQTQSVPHSPDPKIVTQLQSQIESLKSEKNSVIQQMELIKRENTDLRKSTQSQPSSASKDQLDSLDKLVQSLKTELYQFKSREHELIQQNQRLTAALNEVKDKSLSQSMFMDDLQVIQLQNQLEQSNNMRNKLQEDITKLKRQLEQKDTKSDKEKLVKTNAKLMEEISAQNMKIKDLQLEIEMQRNMSRMSMSMSIMEDPIQKQRIEQLEQENHYLTKKIVLLEEDIQKKKNIKPQKNNNERSEQQMQKLQEANKRYMEENLKLFEELRQFREKQDQSLNSTIRQSQVVETQYYQQLEYQLSTLQQKSQMEIMNYKKQLDKLNTEQAHSQEYKMQVDQLSKQNKRLLEENNNMMEQIKQVQQQNQELSSANFEAMQSISRKSMETQPKEDLGKIKRQYDLEREQYLEQISSLQSKIQQCNKLIDDQRSLILAKEKEILQLKDRQQSNVHESQEQFEQKLIQIRRQYEQEIKQLTMKVQSKQQTTSYSLEQSSDESLVKYKDQIQVLNQDISQLRQLSEQLQQENLQVKAQLQRLTLSNRALMQDNMKLMEQIADANNTSRYSFDSIQK